MLGAVRGGPTGSASTLVALLFAVLGGAEHCWPLGPAVLSHCFFSARHCPAWAWQCFWAGIAIQSLLVGTWAVQWQLPTSAR